MSKIHRSFAIAVFAALMLAIAGCGSDSNDTAQTSTETATSTDAVTISTGKTDAGTVLTGPGGKTVYMFKADKNGKSACKDDCAAAWPPVIAKTDAKASGDADQSKLGMTTRSDGQTQVTYAGWPLYFYVKDTAPGDANGNEVEAFGAEWYALTAEGEEAEDASAGEASSSSSGY